MHIGRNLQGSVNTDFKHQAPNITNTTRAENLSGELEYHALQIHIPWYAAAYNFSCISAMSDPTLFVGAYNIRPQECLTTHFSYLTTISGPNNVRLHSYRARLQYQAPKSHTFRARLQYQTPTMSDPTLCVRDYHIRPRQCQTLHLSFESTISGTNNVRPHTFRVRLQYQAPTMSDPTLFVRDYNIRPRQC